MTAQSGIWSRLPGACVRPFSALLLLLFAGCASQMSTKITAPFSGERPGSEEARKHAEGVLKAVEERNATIEGTPDWRAEAYRKFMIRNLASLDEGDYEGFSRYLDNGAAYVIVHPAYYTFFHSDNLFSDPSPGIPGQNAMDRFLAEGSYSSRSRLIKAQEKRLRDFLEYMSTDRKLVILILPRKYRDFPAYKFRNDRDEYMRFINEVTNGSESVLYLYSNKPNRGTLSEKDRRKLLRFLYTVRAKEILVGGGFIGRCLEDFFKDVEQYYSDDKVYLVPEITSISPEDISSGVASDMLNPDGTINVGKLSAVIQKNGVGNQEIIPKIKNISRPRAAP